jgi:hypothetical protein
MASKSPNFFTRIKENVMGTKEQNKAAQERMDAAEAKKKKEKEAAEEKTKMAKGGAVKKKVPTKTAKGSKATKTPVLAIMIGVPKAPKAKKK